MLEILLKWNRWGSGKQVSGYPRKITSKIIKYVGTQDIVVLMGSRRAGKSTILYQVIDHLEQNIEYRLNPKAILHVNFEEPGFATELKLPLLDRIYNTYRKEVYPTGKAYLFLDEIQNVPGWEKWVRSRTQTDDIKIFITGSSSQLMSRELATVLTGRHISFSVYPLSFPEFLHFKSIPIPEKNSILSANPPPVIAYALDEFMAYGGYPEVVAAEDNDRKERLLAQYFDDILFKDIALRHNIRDLQSLKNLAIYLITQTSCLLSTTRLTNLFGISADSARNYTQYLQEAFIIEFAPFFSLKAAERNRNPQKMHVVDLGFRKILTMSPSLDKGKIIETVVHNHIVQKTNKTLNYWKKDFEIDLVLQKNNNVTDLYQIMHEGLDDPKIMKREIRSLQEGQNKFLGSTTNLIINEFPNSFEKNSNINYIPLWQFLLDL